MLLHQNVEGGLGGAELPAPQSVLMKLVIDGVLDQNLPWTLIFIGVGIGLAAWFLKVQVLPFAVGVYLPLYTMAAVFVGGLMNYLLTRVRQNATKAERDEAERRRQRGVLFGSGLVGGGGLTGVLLALWVAMRGGERIVGFPPNLPNYLGQALSLASIALIVGIMTAFIRSKSDSASLETETPYGRNT